jgi:catechol 2,3-dioxygenase-like lactoylglutathione lyase family enzyme
MRIRHIAIASDHPGKAADFYTSQFGFKELKRFGMDPDNPDVAHRPSGAFLTDGHINIAILKFNDDQLGKGLDYLGLHHFGVVVEDTEAWMAKFEKMGLERVPYDPPPGSQAEIKYRGPDGVVFDITDHPWEGSGTD